MMEPEGFVPRVAFVEADDARDAYFAVESFTRSVGEDLARAARDDSVTVAQMNAIGEKYMRLARLADAMLQEWQRHGGPATP